MDMKDVVEKLLLDIKKAPKEGVRNYFSLLSRMEAVLEIYSLKHRLLEKGGGDTPEKQVTCSNNYPNCGEGGVHQVKVVPATECYCERLGIPKAKSEVKLCLVKGCPNGSDAGQFIGDICAPCYRMITTGEVHPACNTFISKMKAESDAFIRALKAVNAKLRDRLGTIRASLDAD